MNITLVIIAITALISFRAFNDRSLMYKLQFNAYQIHERKEWYRFFTHAFVHADMGHLIFNMITLFFFGGIAYQCYQFYFGELAVFLFPLMYVSAIWASSALSYNKHKDNPGYNAVGASGAVSAILMTSIYYAPWIRINFFIPGILYAAIYLFYSYRMAQRGTDNIGHDAHFWGSVYGVIFMVVLKPSSFMDFITELTSVFNHF